MKIMFIWSTIPPISAKIGVELCWQCLSFSFDHCIVCPSHCRFWLPPWHLQTFLNSTFIISSDQMATGWSGIIIIWVKRHVYPLMSEATCVPTDCCCSKRAPLISVTKHVGLVQAGVKIPLTSLTLLHFCVCPESGPGFQTSCYGLIMCSVIRGAR